MPSPVTQRRRRAGRLSGSAKAQRVLNAKVRRAQENRTAVRFRKGAESFKRKDAKGAEGAEICWGLGASVRWDYPFNHSAYCNFNPAYPPFAVVVINSTIAPVATTI